MSALSVVNNYHPDVLTRFNRDVEEHEMTVLWDQGVYRHLRFQKPGTGMYYFDLVTTPGRLVINSDMGTYVFARLADMFEFFTGNGYVNAGYWGEKLQAIDTSGGYREFSEELFKQWVVEDFAGRRDELDDPAGTWAAIRSDFLSDDWVDLGHEESARAALNGFNHEGFTYTDTWDHSFHDFTYHYLWCCHAILWGIQQYRALESTKESAA